MVSTPSEECALEPVEECGMETVLVPRLVEKPKCIKVMTRYIDTWVPMITM